MPAREKLLAAAQRLHAYLLGRHYHRGLLRDPDAGVRFLLRAWRFLKSSFDFLRWHDDYVFVQTQGYWILSYWILFEATANARYLEHVAGLINFVRSLQLQTGELPYVVESPYERRREHYLCYQYNAFQFLRLAAALDAAARLGLVDAGLARQAYGRVTARQKHDGGFIYSKGDYGFLRDTRSYPRPMAMTLFHLLYGAGAGDGFAEA